MTCLNKTNGNGLQMINNKWNKGEPNNYGGREDGLMLCFGKDYEYWNDAKQVIDVLTF